MTNKRSSRADSMLPLRDRLPNTPQTGAMWVCSTGWWIIPTFYKLESECLIACEKLLEENITAVPKRVNITITFT